uniref:Uncharacterized protein n=2 Tax=Phaeomonas parva TaxID=124430 RepID=A0A6U4GU60_9STRA|mmetsp:Transcript_27989/g.89175  ORF Transcript_27989/g.89175 Transcript_27989/m.89175 type:complete len:233 (+) Transcript_27989:93-791(+)
MMRTTLVLAVAAAALVGSNAFTVAPRGARMHSRLFSTEEGVETEAPKAAPKEMSALVPLNTENVEASVGVAGALAGLVLFGNPVIALALAATGNYVTKQESEVGEAFRGVGTALINSLNFVAKMNERYDISDRAGKAAGDAFQTLKEKDTSDAKILSKVEELAAKVSTTVSDLDSEYDLKAKAQELVYSAGDLSTQAIEKATEVNEKYKITDQATTKVKDIVDKAKSKINEQ